MKKSRLFCLSGIILGLLFSILVTAQSQGQEGKLTEENFQNWADNMSYWTDAAKAGIVPFNPKIPIKPAEPIKSRSGAKSIKQMTTDIQIWDEAGVTQSENSVFVDPNDETYVLNSNNSESGGSIYGANYIQTDDAGATWGGSKLGAGGANRGDPAVAISDDGRQYVGYISAGRGQGVAYSDDGASWTNVDITGSYASGSLMDKNHLTVDTYSPSSQEGNVYSAWLNLHSSDANYLDIEFSRSTNNGVSWSSALNISSGIAAGSHQQGVNIQTGPLGYVYAVWSVYDDWGPTTEEHRESAIGFARSTNGGSSFGTATRIFDNIEGIRPDPDSPSTNAIDKNMRCNSYPVMAVDRSGGPNHGDIYVVWTNVGTPGVNTGTNVSIYMIKSTNNGLTWTSTPVRVNQGTLSNDYAAYFPWITCDQATGNLYCVFYDDRNLGSTSSDVEVFVAYSEDGGTTWQDFRVSDVSFTPTPIAGLASGYFGDYIGITALNNHVYPCWTDNRSSTAQTFVSPIEFTDACIATGGCDEYISNVSIGSINNSTDCNGYSNYTDQVASIPVNSSESLSVSIGSYFTGDDVTVWVDWNRDDDFDDVGEEIGYASGAGPHLFTIAPPEGTTQGACTMRVRLSYSGSPPSDPCGTTTYGEVEDYTISLTSPLPNYWTGAFNYYWHNANNWSLGHIPTAIETVYMTTAGYHPPSTGSFSDECNNLIIEAGAGLSISDQTLTIHNDLNVYGDLTFSSTLSRCYVYHDVYWHSGSTGSMTGSAQMFVYEDWNFQAGANVQFNAGYVEFLGSASSWVRSHETDCHFYHVKNSKTGTYGLSVSEGSTQDLYINGNIYNYSGNLIRFRSDHSIFLNGFFNNLGGHFEGHFGTFVFNGLASGVALKPNTGDYFNNLVINTTTALSLDNVYTSELVINGDVDVQGGTWNGGLFDIKVGGNWTNSGGNFSPGTSTVNFESIDTHQDVNGTETFYNVQHVSTGNYLRFYGPATINNDLELHSLCWSYNTMDISGELNMDDVTSRFGAYTGANISVGLLNQGGELAVSGSVFTAGDLVEDGIEGTYHLFSGEISLTQDAGQVPDFRANVIIEDGQFILSGGNGTSWWAYGGDASLTMSGGIFDFNTAGCNLYASPHVLALNITGGTIRSAGNFTINNPVFTPDAGLIELYSSNDATLLTAPGTYVNDLLINKSAKSNDQKYKLSERDISAGLMPNGGSPKVNQVTISTDLDINGDFTIDNGVFNTSTYDMYIAGDWTNNVGNSGFIEGINTVFFDGLTTSDILTEEFFFDLTENKTSGSYTALESFENVIVSHDMHIVDGTLEMNQPSSLIIGNNLTIDLGAGLNANDGSNLIIYVGGNWTNYNTIHNSTTGFEHGNVCTVVFNSGGDNILTTNAPQEDFYNLTIYKSIDQFRTNDNIQVFGKLLLFDGEWSDNISGLTHTFHGDFEVTSNAAWYTHISHNTVKFAGENDQEFIYNTSYGYFRNVIIDKSPTDIKANPDPDHLGSKIIENLDAPKAQTITMYTDMDIQLSGTLTIDEGSLNVNGNTLRGDGDVTINSGGTLLLPENSTLWIDDGSELSVNGGLLECIGTAGNEVSIRHRNTGYYAIEVENGGTISAEYTMFEHMSSNGLFVRTDGLVDPVHAFNYCTFQNGSPGFAPLVVFNNNQILTCTAVNFPQTGVSEINVAKANDDGEVTFINATGSFSGPAYEYDTYGRVHWEHEVVLEAKIYLEGPFNGTGMTTNLNASLPTDQPFDVALPYWGNTPGWYYTGGESVGSIPNVYIVDWVLVELRDATSAAVATPATSVAKQAAFVLNNGSIVGLDGSSNLSFDLIVSNDLYLVIWHRNHLGIISASPLSYSGGTYPYDFTNASSQAFGGSDAMSQMTPGRWAMKSGDGNGNNFIDDFDNLNVWRSWVGIYYFYMESDYNMDEQTNNIDKNDKWVPNLGSSTYIPN